MQEITDYLDEDKDLCNLSLSFQYANSIIGNAHFWRTRFVRVFDSPRPDSFINTDHHFEDQYKKRKDIMAHIPTFHRGNTRRERQCLAVLRDLMRDANSERGSKNSKSSGSFSKNIENYIKTFLTDSNLLNDIFATRYAPQKYRNSDILPETYSQLMRMLQVLMAPSLLDPRPFPMGPQIADFAGSQFMAYSGAKEYPIFYGCNGTDVNFDWCLHQLNFWRNHLLREDEASLNSVYKNLEDHERPQYWHTLLQNNDSDYIGKKWKGSYAYVDRTVLREVREHRGEVDHIIDEFNGSESKDGFQDLRLQLTENGAKTWDPAFEGILRSLAKPPEKRRTRQSSKASSPAMETSKSRSFRFGGGGLDAQADFLADGWLNQLPPQQEVPGWQRMTMMKYYTDEYNNQIDWASLWAYEGVVLPGGQVIIGRWWSPNDVMEDDESYSGPFILWCVDDPNQELMT